jgi:hypothetical protein
MGQTRVDDTIATAQQPHDVAKLIRKLRWIGLEEEARQLQLAMRSASRDQNGAVPIETFSTD